MYCYFVCKVVKKDTQKSTSKVAKDGKAQNVSTLETHGNLAKRGSLVTMNSGVTNITIEFDEQEPVQVIHQCPRTGISKLLIPSA